MAEMKPQEPLTPDEGPRQPPRRRPPSLFWPILLIGAGILMLLSNLGYLPSNWWTVAWRFWPLILVLIGLDLLIGHRSAIGALISALLIIALVAGVIAVVAFADRIPVIQGWIESNGEVRTQHLEYPLSEAQRGVVFIDWESAPGYLSTLEDSSMLISADIRDTGETIMDGRMDGNTARVDLVKRSEGEDWFGNWWEERRWDVELNPNVLLDLTLNGGSGPLELNLGRLLLEKLTVDAGSGPITLVLPDRGRFDVYLEGGSGPINLVLPEGAGVQVRLEKGSGSFDNGPLELVSGERDDDGVWETDNFDREEDQITIYLDQGSGPVDIK